MRPKPQTATVRRQGKIGTPKDDGRCASSIGLAGSTVAGLNQWSSSSQHRVKTAGDTGLSPISLQSSPIEIKCSRSLILKSKKLSTTDNDPSAGSPTETLLRLLLPLNATVWSSSRQPGRVIRQANSPRTSLKRSIGSSDGRCVQRAGT